MVHNITVGQNPIEVRVEDTSLKGLGFKMNGPDHHCVGSTLELHAYKESLKQATDCKVVPIHGLTLCQPGDI